MMKKNNKEEIHRVMFWITNAALGITETINEEFKKDEEEIEKLASIIKEQEQVITVLRNRLQIKDYE